MKRFAKTIAVLIFLVFAVYGLMQFLEASRDRQTVSDAHARCEAHGGVASLTIEDDGARVICTDAAAFDL